MPKKKHRAHTPIVSEAQRGAFGVAYAAKKGKIPVSKLKGVARQMYRSMSREIMREHLKEAGGKKFPYKVLRQRKTMRQSSPVWKYVGSKPKVKCFNPC